VRGATRAHAELQAEPERFLAEVRLLANDAPGEGVWIEKVRVQTRGAVDLAALAERDDAMGELTRALQRLQGDESAQEALFAELAGLEKHLPPELREGDDAVVPKGAAQRRELLAEVEQLLLSRLVHAAPHEAPR
jgi:hypothetical protein